MMRIFRQAVIAILLALTNSADAADSIKFVTESYPPLNFRKNETYVGSSVDQIRELMEGTGVGYSMEMMTWARALSLATTQPGYCVFTTVHNKERDPKFKWIEPLATSRTVLMRKAGANITPKTLDEAKAYVVGTQRDDYTQTLLKENGFPKIDIAANFDLTLKKLLTGRLDLVPLSEEYFAKLKRDGVKVEIALTLAEDVYSIACNPSVSDETIALLQKQLDALIQSGRQKEIFKNYNLLVEGE